MQDRSPRATPVRSQDVLTIAIPMILSNATVPLVGIADVAVVGQLNDPALIGGVSLGSTVFAFLFWAFGFLRMGTTGLTAQAAGAGDRTEIAANLYRALAIAGAAGAVLFLLHVPAILFTLKLIGASAEVQTATAAYFGVRILSAPATLANYALVGWFIGLARANVAFLLQLFLNLLNIALAVVFVLAAGKGVEGAAMAAVCAEYAAAVLGFLIAIRFLRGGSVTRAAVFDRAAFKRLLAVNGDIMIRTVCLMFAFTFFAAQGARLGDVELAANSVLRNMSELSAYVLDGFAFAAEVLVGQAVGARSLPRFRQAVFLSSVWAAVLAACVSAVFWCARPSPHPPYGSRATGARGRVHVPALGGPDPGRGGRLLSARRHFHRSHAHRRHAQYDDREPRRVPGRLGGSDAGVRQSRALGVDPGVLCSAGGDAWPSLSRARTRVIRCGRVTKKTGGE